jgi:hypothetical protein
MQAEQERGRNLHLPHTPHIHCSLPSTSAVCHRCQRRFRAPGKIGKHRERRKGANRQVLPSLQAISSVWRAACRINQLAEAEDNNPPSPHPSSRRCRSDNPVEPQGWARHEGLAHAGQAGAARCLSVPLVGPPCGRRSACPEDPDPRKRDLLSPPDPPGGGTPAQPFIDGTLRQDGRVAPRPRSEG